MKIPKSFDKKIFYLILLSIFNIGISPTIAKTSEEINSNSEVLNVNSNFFEENFLISDFSIPNIEKNPQIEISDIEDQIIWSELEINSQEFQINNNELDHQLAINNIDENLDNIVSWNELKLITNVDNHSNIQTNQIPPIKNLENQFNNQTTENLITQNFDITETIDESNSSENNEFKPVPENNDDFNFEPISLEEALKYTDNSMEQVNSVTQLRDVLPGDWAYDALRNLVENYDCLEGYPNRTFRGDRPMTRYEFAAGLNACLERLEIVDNNDVSDEDLDTLQRLISEFDAEIATLGTRVDNLEGRVAFLEDNQFSTTTKLFGQVIFGVQGRTDNDFNAFFPFSDGDTQINTITNTQLSLFTQFNSRSVLLTGLQAGTGSTIENGPALTNFVRLGYEGNTNSSVQISDLTYRHLITNDLSVVVGAAGVSTVNVFRGPNRVESAGFGPLSRFAQRNPIISVGAGGAGAGFDWQIADRLSMQGVYSTGSANNSTQAGLFGGDNGTTTLGVQLIATPVDNLNLAFQYVNAYSPFGLLGTFVGDNQVALITSSRAPINTDAFGGSVDWRVTPQITLGGWAGYTTSSLESGGGDVDTFNWMSYLSFPDLFAEGNLGAIFVGQPPKITDSNLPSGRNVPDFFNNANFASVAGGQPDSTTHIEAFYRFKVNDNISITPGVIVVLDPGHNSANDTITIGAIRTTLTF